MRYALALLCPPLALWSSGKPFHAIAAGLLMGLALVTARCGAGALIEFFLILWASHAVGHFEGRREALAFAKTVRPIPIFRS